MSSSSPSQWMAAKQVATKFDSIATRIHEVTDEAMRLYDGEDVIARITVVRGYLHLSMMANKSAHVRKLSVALADLSEFVMERGQHLLARRLLTLADEIRALHISRTA